jgi:hypothetical protein
MSEGYTDRCRNVVTMLANRGKVHVSFWRMHGMNSVGYWKLTLLAMAALAWQSQHPAERTGARDVEVYVQPAALQARLAVEAGPLPRSVRHSRLEVRI